MTLREIQSSELTGAAEALTTATTRLFGHVSHWTPPRWAASGATGPRRADIMADLVQRIADLAADAEGQPHRAVPRLESDLALGDQLRVVTADLVAARPAERTLLDAAAEVEAVHQSLTG